jgi:acyl carrier protein
MTDIEMKMISVVDALLRQKAQRGDGVSGNEVMDIEIAGLHLDSLEKMELIMEIEDACGVLLDEESVLKCTKIKDLVGLVEQTV